MSRIKSGYNLRMSRKRIPPDDRRQTSKYFKPIPTPDKNKRIDDAFYHVGCQKTAKSLLGMTIARRLGGTTLRCKIVEVEVYTADDKSSHSYNLKQTKRNEAMFMKAGTLYVYMTYGMYYCMNISSAGKGDAVLLRAAEPLEGFEIMQENRAKSTSEKQKKNVTNGPSKLCQALAITKEQDKLDLSTSEEMWLEIGTAVNENEIITCKRIGLNEKRSGDWALKPLRFYIYGNPYVSFKDKLKENNRKI
uniref:DNA-3-methyladenine glycosylase n=1 Tax=Ciona savignyi TaxID=51511 RepID=H2ZCG6_CIOSA